jgi:hypothetical protein
MKGEEGLAKRWVYNLSFPTKLRSLLLFLPGQINYQQQQNQNYWENERRENQRMKYTTV